VDNSPKHLRVFVSSPGDVFAERDFAFQLLERLPYDPLLRGRITLETVAWDMPGGGAPMLATVTPQEAIDRELPKPSQCDIVVVILWARIGTPLWNARKPDGTPYLSGTEWEYEDAMRSETKPPILVYRRTTPTTFEPGDPESEQRLAQWKSVEEFFQRFHNLDGSARGGYRIYENPTDFGALLDHDLRAVIKRVLDEPADQAQIFLSVGDRLAVQKRYAEALEQYGIALRASPRNVAANRRVVSVMRERLLLRAFGPGSSIGIALRHDLGTGSWLRLAPSSEVDASLSALYRAQALDPELEEDVGLLIDEALILKAGQRFQEAVDVLRKAHGLAPANVQVLAELGLLLALFSKTPAAKAEGIRLLRDTLGAEPGDARSHLYLANALAESCLCPYAGLDYAGGNDADACAEAIREYHRAADLASDDDTWQIRVRARESAMNIFYRYARKEGDILTPRLAMPFDERLRELQWLTSEASPNQSGIQDDPTFWMVVLQRATGSLEAAERTMRALLQSDHDQWLGAETNYWEDSSYIERRLVWFEVFGRILEERATDPEALGSIRSVLRNVRQSSA
jgi:tetratricopeptide (TPR) repeat protein